MMDLEAIKDFFAKLSFQKVLPAILILVVGIILVKLLMKLFTKALEHSRLNRTMFGFMKTVMRILLYGIVILIAAGSLGVDVSSLIAVLSVLSLAVSLAVQNVLSNVVGSMQLLSTHPFQVGDYVEIGPDGGTVEEIDMSYTKIMTADGRRIYIPNRDASGARICNYTVAGKRRLDLFFTASYEDSVDEVRKALLEAAAEATVLPDTQPAVVVNDYKDSAVEYMLQIWVAPENYFPSKFAVTEKVKRLFDERHISIPFPQLEVRTRS